MKLPAGPLHTQFDWLGLVEHPELTLVLDLDGTLIPFAPTAEQADLGDDAVAVLAELRRAGVRVVIVSGRPRRLVAPMQARCAGLWWFAEHGSWCCDASGVWVGPDTATEIDELEQLLAPYVLTNGPRLERKSLSICLHWRQCVDVLKAPLIAAAELACDEWLETHPEFERISGVEMLEVRRRASHKGVAIARIRERAPAARIIAIGDDVTDEDMFAALRDDEVAIGVGPRITARATLGVADPSTVVGLLRWMIELRSGQRRPFPGLHQRAATAVHTSLVVVSNRIPPAETGRARPVGGLVSALEPALDAHDGIWLGWSGRESDGERALVIDDPKRASFDFPVGWRDRFYGGFCNRALWPLFHGFPGRVRYSDADWQSYVSANAEFARHAHGLVRAGGTIWAHDYHLLLIAKALRERGFTGRTGLFLHVPFPNPDLFDTLPWGDEIITAMLEFDTIGFHTERWAHNFLACANIHAPNALLSKVAILPIGVDPTLFATPHGSKDVASLQAALGDRRLILGIDRLDYSKGIPERLLAFERLIETQPEWRTRVSLVQISVPSREEVPEYAQLRHEVESLVGRINGRYGEADWVPVRYLYRSYEREVLAQLYRAADVALVTPLRDGLNLVAKEFVVSQDPERPGVLVLSRFAGAAVELRDAIITNPFHPDGLARDLDRALRMSLDERKRRHHGMMVSLAGNTPHAWATKFLSHLQRTERSVA